MPLTKTTETESEESSSERVKPTSRVSHEKNSRKLNFLSSLGSHGEGATSFKYGIEGVPR